MKAILIAIIAFTSTGGSLCWAHARLKSTGDVVPRSDSAGLKTGPCGGVPRTSNAREFEPGQTITVEWEETINHPGRFEFYFSQANDSGFSLMKTVNDGQDGSADLPHQYSTTITLPRTPCDACTLQMIQVMTENPSNPSYYYSCADIRIRGASTVPVPSPPPQDQCGGN